MSPPTTSASNHLTFDPWNSASTGHQRGESNPGTAWQRTREAKLAQQLRTGDCTINPFAYGDAQENVYEKGEWEWDWGGDAKGGRGGGGRGVRSGRVGRGPDSKQRDIRSMMRVKKAGDGGASSLGLDRKAVKDKSVVSSLPASTQLPGPVHTPTSTTKSTSNPELLEECEARPDQTPGAVGGNDSPALLNYKSIPEQPQIRRSNGSGIESTMFRDATIYINGQTAPLISDHKLKGLLVAHGATLSLSLSRRVTHVIIGKPNSGPGRGGAGGGLAAGKIQKEAQRGGWRGMRIVGVEWYVYFFPLLLNIPLRHTSCWVWMLMPPE